ncbi:MAG: 6,7-dimethyl-8-ribityllumazine synthase [Candidatus Magasanikbacteria bacterium]|uniref:6,7-dimethyl-8-ribityllumazine synthase n=1 Tax=Candidatus Magasanikbacteria bacterium CG10_big_fil_rev_8_21_14_0_10_38_6 TaxID=1974647 RepID=A0A2M6P2D0_9BACT|nr:6,7-dimethyl-8-ribityllumazine synthase [Candidatus Magasanikbacteria bacterium]NCS71743.1 6,7-dimethyl-8-ribityllumazine synthase [Candidatus Magasanikbacteria bacterium]PIR77847.1 MAG: 6,7-dimethyl-8-ribityllumazine synthase [Candidatus Magasanikbacteria bacterium CG10_big_fil_rev_8_21_14_0_10_38_6]
MAKGITLPKQQGVGKRIGIVSTLWNKEVVDQLVNECKQALLDSEVANQDIILYEVPGAYELPRGAKQLMEKEHVDAVVCIGVLVKGQTMHFEYISEAVTQGIMTLNLTTDIPVTYGVLNCLSEDQVLSRKNHAYEWGLSAIHMSNL